MNDPTRASRCSLLALGVLAATYPPLWFILLRSRFPMHHAEGTGLDRFYLFVALSGVALSPSFYWLSSASCATSACAGWRPWPRCWRSCR